MELASISVGELVYLRVSGRPTAFRVMHQGKPDDSYDDSFLGGTILMLDCSETPVQTQMVETVDGQKEDYSGSWPHQMLNSTWLAELEPQLAQRVVQVRLPYRQGTGLPPYTVATGSDGLPAKVWLPSIAEVSRGDEAGELSVTEGAMFQYFHNGGMLLYSDWAVQDQDPFLDRGWGTRTQNTFLSGDYADFYCVINGKGQWVSGFENAVAVRPCLVLPGDTAVDAAGRIVVGTESPVKVDGLWRTGVSWVKTDGIWHKTVALHGKVDGTWKT